MATPSAPNKEQTATSGCTSCACGGGSASPPPIQFVLNRLIIPIPGQGHEQTKVTFPLPTGKLGVSLEKGDVFVLGLKKVPSGCATGCCSSTTPPGEAKCGAKDEKAKVDEKEKEKDAAKKVETDLAPLGGTYELTLEPVLSDDHDLVRVLGAVFRKYDDDKVLLQILPEHMSLCKLFLHTHTVDTSATVGADTSKLSKHARHFFHRLHASQTAPKDENGLLVGEGGWARIPDGYALNVSPEINNVREGGTDVKLEISFKSSHEHDVASAFATVHSISQDKHDWVVVSTSSGGHVDEEKEVISTGCHIVTGVHVGA